MELINTYKSKISENRIQQDIFFAQIDNNTSQTDTIFKQIDKRFVQFYFCTKGNVTFHFSDNYQRPLQDGKGFVIFNSVESLPLQLSVAQHSKMSLIVISIQKLHFIFNENSSHLAVFNSENNTKLYEEIKLSNIVRQILFQMENYSLKDEFKNIYLAGKLNELFLYYFSEIENSEENCPYLSNEELARKLKHAKEILIKSYLHPLSNIELAKKVDLNPYKLKEGFKKIYGVSTSKFLQEYKMELGRLKLEENRMQVKEIAKELGYDNPSHFIDAFKKKYGITPKQFSK